MSTGSPTIDIKKTEGSASDAELSKAAALAAGAEAVSTAPPIPHARSFPAPHSGVLGTIKGHRSESGTMTILGSFVDPDNYETNWDQSDITATNRERANTAPSWIPSQQSAKVLASSEPPAILETPSEDEDVKLAMAMALAIQKNPHLTPAEIHQLQQELAMNMKSNATATVEAAAKPAALIPGRLAVMFAAPEQPSSPPATTAKRGFGNSIREMARGRLSEMIMATTANSDSSMSSIRDAPPHSASDPALSPAISIGLLPFRGVVPAANAKPAEEAKPAPKEAAYAPKENGTAKTAPKNEEEHSDIKKKEPAKEKAGAKPTASAYHPPGKATETAASAVGAAANIVAGVVKESLGVAGDVVAGTGEVVTGTGEAIAGTGGLAASIVVDSAAAPSKLLQLSTAIKKELSLKEWASSASNQSQTAFSTPEQKPRLTGIAWKRRGGMGKYSTTSAWERRRISLEGTKLLYYMLGNEDDNNNSGDNICLEDEAGTKDSPSETGGNRSTWFDHATHWNSASCKLDSDPSSAPRGYIDLAKEKATVHAAFGHSGAPTPFALSVKVRSETKWKLCFDRHASQMEWLAAITDVVVQCSVDTYNASLLEAADPAVANHQSLLVDSNYALFHPPRTKDGPATREGPGSGRAYRLWMLEKYRVQSDDHLSAFDSDDEVPSDQVKKPASVKEEAVISAPAPTAVVVGDSALDHMAAQDEAQQDAKKMWVVPEDNLLYAVAILNFAVLVARSSSISVDGFWHVLVFANLGIFVCLVQQPCWRSILERVRAIPTSEPFEPQMMKASADIASASDDKMTPAVASKVQVLEPKKFDHFVPVAGSSALKIDEPTDPPKNGKGEMFAGWRPMPGEILQVRSHGYADTKKKIPSPGELYECVAVDVFESPHRYPDMGSRVKLPKTEFEDAGPKTWRSPDIFVISIALPTDPPKMGRSSSDGGGYTVTMYYRMKPETREILRRVTADEYDPSTEQVGDPQKSRVNAVRLLEEWIRRSPTDPKFQARFKVVPNAHNLKEIGMPSWISKYNGTPFLIKRAGVTGFLQVHPELSCVEFDISLHPFPYLAKQGICFMKESYFKKVLVTFGFVIEGRGDDELPECLIGLMQLCYPDPQYAIQASDFFSGIAPRSC